MNNNNNVNNKSNNNNNVNNNNNKKASANTMVFYQTWGYRLGFAGEGYNGELFFKILSDLK